MTRIITLDQVEIKDKKPQKVDLVTTNKTQDEIDKEKAEYERMIQRRKNRPKMNKIITLLDGENAKPGIIAEQKKLQKLENSKKTDNNVIEGKKKKPGRKKK